MLSIAILAEDSPGFITPMAHGLVKMLSKFDVHSHVFYDGLQQLEYTDSSHLKQHSKNLVKKVLNVFKQRQYRLQQVIADESHQHFIRQLAQFDAVVVVCPLPRSFDKHCLVALESLRQQLGIPFVLYQNYYLATRGPWYQQIKASGGFGLERFDWYLAASITSDFPLHNVLSHPVNVIGHDLVDDSLNCEWGYKAKQPFTVLLDFERSGFEAERKIQIAALEQLDIPFTCLKGEYSLAQIRQMYREHHGLMLSFRESFGLPIIENQLCGNLIFTPSALWVPSHYLDKPIEQAGAGDLGDNFVVYHDLASLKAALTQAKSRHENGDIYTSQLCFRRFVDQYPQYYHGVSAQLELFLQRLNRGEINSFSHLDHAKLNDSIVAEYE